MLSRIKDGIKGFNTDDHLIDDTLETEYIWKKKDIVIYMEDVNKAFYSSEYKKEYRILENKDIEEYIYIYQIVVVSINVYLDLPINGIWWNSL